MYFDAVLNSEMQPVCNKQTPETVEWLKENPAIRDGYMVCIGTTLQMVTPQQYLEMMDK